jgi:phosphohistidine phosphatase
MLRLLLLRHAKSSWAEHGVDDRQRPLNKRGREAAPVVGRHLRRMKWIPDLVICSPAERTRRTLELVIEAAGSRPEIAYDEAVYDFGDGNALIDVIRVRGGNARTLMIVGHNPSMEFLAIRLARSGPPDAIAEIRRKFPTAALAVFDVDAPSWAAFDTAACTLTAFVRPRALDD